MQMRCMALGLGLLFSGSLVAQDTYRYQLDLTQVVDDQLKIVLNTPAVTDSLVEFQIPKIVPGTYSISDFGRFVSSFMAYDVQGNSLSTDQVGVNRWQIANAEELAQITYTLDDTYDTDLGNVVFEPSGTNFEIGDNFVINNHGMFGYLKGYENQPFEVAITRPENFYGASALDRKSPQGNTDIFTASRYFDLADSPIMYCEPDTATVIVGGAEVIVSVYSPGDKVSAAFVRDQVTEILKAQEAYLGGNLPVDRYAFLIYLFEGNSLSGAYGALEHSYSSMYFLPEYGEEQIAEIVRNISSHEFFHIVTPLNIHSEEIGDFDFIDPQMSQHLWLYEGVTEYSSHHAQIVYGLTDLEDFLSEFREKIIDSRQNYNDELPFTEMSKYVLDRYEDEYGNVYQKGALIGFCLDITLRQWSEGDYGLQNLMRDLAKSYGKDVSFQDDGLFDKIAELTDPSIKNFLTTYVSGPTPLPIEASFNAIGVNFVEEMPVDKLVMGVGLNYNSETERIFIQDISAATEFAQKLKLQAGDELVSIKGNELNINNFQGIFEDLSNTPQKKKVTMTVMRPQEDGSYRKVKLKAKAITTEVIAYNVLEPKEELTVEEDALRNAWLSN
ncbi:MAG TPA: peptidase M61 [Cytophagales bacterium]|nr:peptidase M61 [Cytophagales bacterium]HAA18332.1 peptidase M61 [Cytophagales bacterium]HAP59578.1 peptidase M61 [Cytophagales bacterium]